ncbi:hypothetical protein L7F22_012280 [Adiantum nelumboides]|nr:hypothetical protein [Adiantum nelumboides]
MYQQLQQAARDSLVEGLSTVRSPTGVCEPCQLGKQHRVAFPKQASTRASAPLALVHTDLCGPMSTSSLSGLCYMLVLVDDFSRYTWVSFLKLKSEAFGSIRDWKAMVEKEKDLKVKSIRSDRGDEFLSEDFARWCKSEGIRRQLTTPYTPSQNGVVERKNRTIMEMARAMLAHASLPRSYWAEACNTAEKRQKLDFKSRKLLFLGYSAESDAYRLYDPDTRTTIVSRDVVFDESFITSAEGAAALPIPILPPPSLPDPPASPVITPSTSHPVPPIQPDVSPDHALSDSDSDLDVADATPEVDSAPPRREKCIPGWLYSTSYKGIYTLMSSVYKILARMITLRLRPFLPDLIHSSQTGFVHDRSILDNVVTFYEAVEWARQTGQPTAIMLLDFEKAYDRVDWGFLEGTLHRMGFPDAWIRGISALYRSASAVVTIGTMALYLRGRTPQIWGLHMPIDASPDLVEQEYVDDTMIFCHGSLINWHKSSGLVVGVDDVCTWGEHQGFTWVALGQTCRYLGFRAGLDVSPRQQFEPVLASIRRKLCHWASMYLSLAGRALVVNQVLLATAWFTTSCWTLYP